MSDQEPHEERRLGFRLRYVEDPDNALGELLGPYDVERLRGLVELAIENADPLVVASLIVRGAALFAREVDDTDVEVVRSNDEHELAVTGAFPRALVLPQPQG